MKMIINDHHQQNANVNVWGSRVLTAGWTPERFSELELKIFWTENIFFLYLGGIMSSSILILLAMSQRFSELGRDVIKYLDSRIFLIFWRAKKRKWLSWWYQLAVRIGPRMFYKNQVERQNLSPPKQIERFHFRQFIIVIDNWVFKIVLFQVKADSLSEGAGLQVGFADFPSCHDFRFWKHHDFPLCEYDDFPSCYDFPSCV